MFRSRRQNVVTQLWKSRVDRVSSSASSRPSPADDPAAVVAAEDEQDRCCWARRRRRGDLFDRRDRRWETTGDEPMPPSTPLSAARRDQSPAAAGVDAAAGRMVPKSDVVSAFERFGLSELELLLEVVQGAGHQVSGCIPAPVDPPPPEDDMLLTSRRCRRARPHLLCWLLYRWTPLDGTEAWRDVESSELKKMPGCAGETESTVCCNPYHWSRIAGPLTDTSK